MNLLVQYYATYQLKLVSHNTTRFIMCQLFYILWITSFAREKTIPLISEDYWEIDQCLKVKYQDVILDIYRRVGTVFTRMLVREMRLDI